MMDMQTRMQALEATPSGDPATISRLAERVNTAVRTMESRLDTLVQEGYAADPEELEAMVSRAVATQLRGVTSRLRGDVDKAVGVAMQTMQRTIDVSAVSSGTPATAAAAAKDSEAFALLARRLDVLEQTVTAEQEMSLSTLETIMRATQRAQAATAGADAHGARSAAPAPGGGGGGTGILSVAVAP